MTIKILDKTYKVILNYPAQINLKSSLCPMIRSAYLSSDCKNLIIGTIASEIYEIVTKYFSLISFIIFKGIQK